MTENKNFLESLSDNKKPESFEQETFIQVKSPKRVIGLIISIFIILTVILSIFLIYQTSSRIKLIDFVGMTIEDASVWAQRNDVLLITENVYSFDSKEKYILVQDPSPGSEVKKNDPITVQASAGPDPDELVAFPDVSSMTLDDINEWIDINKLTGVRISTSASHIIPENHIIDYSFVDGSADSFKRKNRVNITVSTGPDVIGNTVIVSDFTSMNISSILQWSEENGVKVEIIKEFNSYINSGSVIRQNIKAGTEIFKTDVISIYLSKGESVTVPDFTDYSKEEVTIWAKLNGISITTIERYNYEVFKGDVVSQSIPEGSIIEKGSEIMLVYSLGNVDVISYVDRTKLDILTWQTEVNGKGADIRLIFNESYSDKGIGKIIEQSIQNDRVVPGTIIEVTISLGESTNTVEIPDFSNMTASGIFKWSLENGVKVEMKNEYNSYIGTGSVIRQSVTAGAKILKTETVEVFFSRGEPVLVPDFMIYYKEEINIWAKQNNINITTVERYNSEIPKGKVLSQSISKDTVIEKNSEIILVYSLGNVNIINYIGRTKLDILTWQTEVNDKGADIEIVFDEDYGDIGTFGKIIAQSIQNDSVSPGTILEISLSKGAAVIVPDFKGKTGKEIEALINEQVLSVVYEYQISETVSPGYLISQSHPAGTLILDSQEIVLTLAISDIGLDTVIIPDLSSMTVDDAIKWANYNNINLEIYEYYSEFVKEGYIINQSVTPGSLTKKDTVIKIAVSIGRAS